MNAERADRPSGERGAALLIALLAAVFLTILGLVLLEILRGGMAQAASSEAAVKAEALAQRGLDETIALVRERVDAANGPNSDVKQRVDAVQSGIGGIGDVRVDLAYGHYEIEVSRTDNYAAYNDNIGQIPDYPYAAVLTVTSTGVVSETRKLTRTVAKTAKIYVSTINPVFKYPVSAAEDVSLFGAPYIVGDVLSRTGALNVSDTAAFIGSPDSSYTMQSAWPTVEGFRKSSGVVHFHPLNGKNPSVLPAFDGIEPFDDPDMPDDEPIDIAESKVDPMIAKMNGLTGYSPLISGDLAGHINPFVAGDTRIDDEWVTYAAGNSSVIENGSLAVRNGAFILEGETEPDKRDGAKLNLVDGSLYVDYKYLDEQAGIEVGLAAAYFAGELKVAPSQAVVVRGNVVIGSGFQFAGRMYVDGDLKIVGKVDLDGTIFVKGDIEMKEMTSINAGIDKPLILAASGQLIFSDSRPEDDKGIVRAFLYSEENVALYGITSRLTIRGGVHGDSVKINAVREGDAASKTASPDKHAGDGDGILLTSTSDQRKLSPNESNLKVFFDSVLYTDPPIGIPTSVAVHWFVQYASN
ncbi:hypothetical protein ACF3MZ_29755 [Paenibacillaceae bacterium WGS1546]|uniref:hypothetical protein n=1 Tax=Cohnella sp. WGS1546 TaxID=3366810 RepID=UPI00372CEFBA